MHPTHCPHCRASLSAPRSRTLSVLALALAWIGAMTMVFIGILTGPIIIFLLPFLVPSGIAMVTAAHQYAFAEHECEACGKLVEARTSAGSPTHAHTLARA